MNRCTYHFLPSHSFVIWGMDLIFASCCLILRYRSGCTRDSYLYFTSYTGHPWDLSGKQAVSIGCGLFKLMLRQYRNSRCIQERFLCLLTFRSLTGVNKCYVLIIACARLCFMHPMIKQQTLGKRSHEQRNCKQRGCNRRSVITSTRFATFFCASLVTLTQGNWTQSVKSFVDWTEQTFFWLQHPFLNFNIFMLGILQFIALCKWSKPAIS